MNDLQEEKKIRLKFNFSCGEKNFEDLLDLV